MPKETLSPAAVDVPRQPISPEAFKDAFRRQPGGVAVVTADDGNGPAALTVTSVASVSAEPPLIVFSVSELSSAAPTILGAESIVVHLIDVEGLEVAKLAATHGIDRFADTAQWTRLPTGEPMYLGVGNWLRCRIVDRVLAGGSTLVVGMVLETGAPGELLAPVVYHDRTWHALGTHSQL
ncbi:MAG TPA: flavin reductase family protein [Microbacteriaceae bacterium]|nr:flavin reductase family protein [Microbacteriaceae bacterium]